MYSQKSIEVCRLEGAWKKFCQCEMKHSNTMRFLTLQLHTCSTHAHSIHFYASYTVEETHEVHCNSNPGTEFQNSEQRTAEKTMHPCTHVCE